MSRIVAYVPDVMDRSKVAAAGDCIFVSRPADLANLPLRVDLARHAHRPGARLASSGQNFLYDPARSEMRPLTDDQLFRQLPVSHRICRIYAHSDAHADILAAALDALVGPGGGDDLTNV